MIIIELIAGSLGSQESGKEENPKGEEQPTKQESGEETFPFMVSALPCVC
jgi:hypothetical protein